MKKLSDAEIYKIFKPELTPKKMLDLGVFGGSYFGNNIKEFPKNWFTNAKLSKTFDVSINRFQVKSNYFWRVFFFVEGKIISMTASNFLDSSNSKKRLKKLIGEFAKNTLVANIN